MGPVGDSTSSRALSLAGRRHVAPWLPIFRKPVFAARAEPRLLRAVHEQRLEPLYNFVADLLHMNGQPVPFLPARERRVDAVWTTSSEGNVEPRA